MFLAGQTGMDRDGTIVAGGVVAQFEQALGNLLTALEAAGGTPDHLTSLTIYIVDMDDYRAHAREIGGGVAAVGRHRLPGHGRHRRAAAVGHRAPSWRCRGSRSCRVVRCRSG